jgi:outer membrane lipoprotein-sorting protein
MRRVLLGIATGLMFFAASAAAQTADDIIAKYVKTIGGMERIQTVKTIRTTGKFIGGGGFEAVTVDESKRPNLQRSEFRLQGMTGVTAYDGKTGWKIEPWQGKKDAESLSEEEIKPYLESTFDDAIINYKQNNLRVEYVGMDDFEGTDAYKLKVTYPSGTIKHYFMDTDYYVPIKIETKRMIRGAEVELETILGDYKEVGGVYYPHSFESGAKGSQNRAKISIEKIEINVPLDDSRFARPSATATTQQSPTKMDASMEKPNEKKTEDATKKPL